jgi:hypothetical protein
MNPRKAFYLLFMLPVFILSGLIISSHVILAYENCTTGKSCTYVDPWGGGANLDRYREFCDCCYNGHVDTVNGNPRCVPGSGNSSSSSGGTSPCISTGDPLVDLACQMGHEIGKGIHDALVPSPEELQRREDERKKLEEDQRRRAEELERQRLEEEKRIRAETEARYKRIKALLKNTQDGVPPSPPISLEKRKRGNDLFNSGNANVGLIYDFKHASSIETINTESAITQLKSVAYLSSLASITDDEDTAKFYSDAAFELVTKGTMKFKIPDNEPGSVEGVAVDDSLNQTKKLWEMYEKNKAGQEKLKQSQKLLAIKEEEKRIAEQDHQKAEKKVKELEDKIKSIPTDNIKERSIEDAKVAEAKKLLGESGQIEDKMTKELEKAKDMTVQSEKEFNKTEKSTRDFIKELGR